MARTAHEQSAAKADVAGPVAAAVRLALSGDLDRSLHRLDALERTAVPASVLDLHARVLAQAGRLEEAYECWARLLEHEPGHTGATAGRRRLDKLRARQVLARTGRRRARGAVAGGALVALGASVAAGAILVAQPAMSARSPDALAQVEAGQAATQARLDELSRRLDVVPAPSLVLASFRDGGPALVQGMRALDPPGGGRLLVFPIGLFSSDDDLTPVGRDTLRDLGRRLALAGIGTPNGPRLTVVGHSATGSESADSTGGTALGLRRAVAAANELATSGGFGVGTLNLASAGATDPPAPGTTADDRTLNRTVTIRVEAP